ncbi:hypothetical protein M885DRAFT_540034 [Pelagophyceae sp. CCMP2097]|nr:hypothetical protein M885DRAFT_540034 [Pelagophyceae sp. CCMP2097]
MLPALEAQMLAALRLNVPAAAALVAHADCFCNPWRSDDPTDVDSALLLDVATAALDLGGYGEALRYVRVWSLDDGAVADVLSEGARLLDRLQSDDFGGGASSVAAHFGAALRVEAPAALLAADLEGLVLLATDPLQRGAALRRAHDFALDFVLKHLPSLPLDPVEFRHEGVWCRVSGLSLSGLALRREDVRLGVDATAHRGELVAAHVSARFEKLRWRVRQERWPHLEAEGDADVVVREAQLSLAVALRRRRSGGTDECEAPMLELAACRFDVATLELKCDEHRLSWAMNLLATAFNERIKDSVSAQVADFIERRLAAALLRPANDALCAAWPAVSLASGFDVADLVVSSADGAVDVAFYDEGPLGLDLNFVQDAADAANGLFVRAAHPGSQAHAAVDACGLAQRAVAGARVAAINGRDTAGLGHDEVVELITAPARPLVLTLRLATAARRLRPGLEWTRVSFAADDRPLGMKLREHATIAGACEVAFVRRDGAALAAERARKIRCGMLLVSCGAASAERRGLVAVGQPAVDGGPEKTFATRVGDIVKDASGCAAARREALVLVFCESPDRAVAFEAPPDDAVFAGTGAFFVVAALKRVPSPLAAAVRPGDVLVALDRVALTADAPLARRGDAAYPLVLSFRRPGAGGAPDALFDVTLQRRVHAAHFGLCFAGGADRGPCRVKRVDPVVGPAASKLLRPGLAVVAVDGAPVSPGAMDLEMLRRLLYNAKSAVFRDVDLYLELRQLSSPQPG